MPTGPDAVRALLRTQLPGVTISKREQCWYFWAPGAECLFTTSLVTYRLSGDPQAWVDAIREKIAETYPHAYPETTARYIADTMKAIEADPKWADVAMPTMVGGVMRFPRPTFGELFNAAVQNVEAIADFRDELKRLAAGERAMTINEAIRWGSTEASRRLRIDELEKLISENLKK